MVAYGLVTYDVPEVVEGVGSRCGAFPARFFPLLFSFPLLGDLPGDRRLCALPAVGVRTLDGEVPD